MTRRLPTDERVARVALSRLGEPGSAGIRDAVARWGAVDALDRFVRGSVIQTGVDPERFRAEQLEEDLRHTDQLGARILSPADAEWPAQLRDLPVPPLCLWVRGPIELGPATERSVAIVGARSATAYGTQTAADLAAGLGGRGFAVVSGGAYGIDAAAHRGALAADADTVAVMAGGIDRLYPSSHTQLLGAIAGQGALITEQPPGVAPIGSRFLSRNRIIAALACGTVIVEASLRSGSLNTAKHTEDLHRPIGAVPGPVTSMQSSGCHQWIRDMRAQLVTDSEEVADLMGRLGLDLAPVKRGASRVTDELDPADRALFEALPLRNYAAVDALSHSVNLTQREVLASLGRLEMRRLAQGDGLDGWRKAPPTRPPAGAGGR